MVQVRENMARQDRRRHARRRRTVSICVTPRCGERGPIREHEVFEAAVASEILESYEHDEPYPSVLLFGRTVENRPIHVVCAYESQEDQAIVITVYEPDPNRWEDFRRRVP